MRNLLPILFTVFLWVSCQSPTSTTTNSGSSADSAKTVEPDKDYGLSTADWSTYQQQVTKDSSHQLVDLRMLAPELAYDIRYATDSNFVKMAVYPFPGAYTRKPVADALKRVQSIVGELGYQLKVYDAYRPYSVTVKFYESYPDTTYVASPYFGSRHNRGAAIDLTLVDASTGKEINMGTPYDDFTERAHPDFMDLPDSVIYHRKLLMRAMSQEGFDVYPSEWWHYDFRDWQQFPLLNVSFEELRSAE